MARHRSLRGATRTCVKWQTVRVQTASGKQNALRCARYTGQAGCPAERGYKKGYAECLTVDGTGRGRRYASGAKYPILHPARG